MGEHERAGVILQLLLPTSEPLMNVTLLRFLFRSPSAVKMGADSVPQYDNKLYCGSRGCSPIQMSQSPDDPIKGQLVLQTVNPNDVVEHWLR